MKPSDFLRLLADNIDASADEKFSLVTTHLNHWDPVSGGPSLGNMIIDRRYLGQTILLTSMPVTDEVERKIRDVLEGRS